MRINRIYIISLDEDKYLNAAKTLQKLNPELTIATRFSTSQDYAEGDFSNRLLYYISEDQLNLDFKNNALLYVLTDSDTQESTGMNLEEYYNNQIIPISVKAFNTINNANLENCLVVWIDTKISKSKYSKIDYQLNMIESKYLLNNLERFNGRFLYFSPIEKIEESMKIVEEFYNGDESIRSKILEENS